MENILKHRGQKLNSKEWVEGNIWHDQYYIEGQSCVDTYIIRDECDEDFTVKEETIGLISDIKAKNIDKFISVGDIVKISDNYDAYGINAGEIYEVIFQFGGFRLKPKRSKAKGFYVEDQNELELIGNKFDNPELLPKSN